MPTNSIADMREANLRYGAVPIQVTRAASVFDLLRSGMISSTVSPANLSTTYTKGKDKSYSGTSMSERQLAWFEMERLGFRFENTDICCFCPWELWASEKGDNFGGPQRAALAFAGRVPVHFKQDTPRDAQKRDISVQISHLCHQPWCCRPDHLILELAWRNKARNFCCGPCKWTDAGGVEREVCGCMLNFLVAGNYTLTDAGPPCLRAYSYVDRSVYPKSERDWCTTIDSIKDRLATSRFPLTFNWVLGFRGPPRSEQADTADTPAAKQRRLEEGWETAIAASPVLSQGMARRQVEGPGDVPSVPEPAVVFLVPEVDEEIQYDSE